MGQYWMLVNIDKRQSTGSEGKLGEFLTDSSPGTVAESLLCRLLPCLLRPEAEALTKDILKHVKSPLESGLGRLAIAVELLDLIFSSIDNIRDATCLCISNKTLFAIGYKHILRIAEGDQIRWEGDRIICLGDYAEDLPEGMLSSEEVNLLRLEGQELDDSDPEDTVLRLYDIAAENFDCISGRWSSHSYDSREWRMAGIDRKLYCQLSRPYYVYHDRWVLCNLSKLQYVRADTVAEIVGDALRLGDVLLSQICWSTDPSCAIPYKGKLHRGAWAGDRFIVTTMDKIEGSLRENGTWTDVTKDVMKQVTEIWRSVYGPEWPEQTED
ncbi:hypothetical protein GLOTRDRAFT_133858 [Gloeophyllum trabeum ATCC 11539]|uniref:Uncharacterized protein n=1 Tax=Gloeophyllum trabeum (strain ATCC 11539 / FP-39264 / Madison 617) TaxID=670483 RepID=S7R840_GLOTA|nr:uncharacterized protein GLOTRDRAFT_133858 [Gloeophyllum trabeum ATCC 11539]EPQ50485.1 hypothetical protein GLOTRDRAFT_133858 [Gloeophyllum trabeum ATCC 11539]